MSDPVSLYLDQNLELSQFLILVILIGVSVYAVVVLICIFLMANNVKHLFVSLFAICGASLIAGKESIHLQCRKIQFDSWVRKICWIRDRLPIPVFWHGEFHGLYIRRGRKESDTTE